MENHHYSNSQIIKVNGPSSMAKASSLPDGNLPAMAEVPLKKPTLRVSAVGSWYHDNS